MPGGDRLQQGVGVHHTPAGGVDQDGALLHGPKGPTVEHVQGEIGERNVDGDHIGPGQHPFQVGRAGHPFEPVIGQERIVGGDLHAQGRRRGRHPTGDAAEAHHSQKLACKFHRGMGVDGWAISPPKIVPDDGQPLGRRQHQGDSVLGGGNGGTVGVVAHPDSPFGGRGHVHRVASDARAGDHPKPRRPVHDRPIVGSHPRHHPRSVFDSPVGVFGVARPQHRYSRPSHPVHSRPVGSLEPDRKGGGRAFRVEHIPRD